MKSKFFLVLGIVLLFSPVLAFAGSACAAGASTGPTVILSNGHLTDFDFVAPSGTNYYQTTLTAGHSYSFEVLLDYDDAATSNPIAVTLYKDGTCTAALSAGSATTGYRDTLAMEPAAPLNSFRGSVIAQVSGPYTIKAVNSDGVNGRYISVAVAETSLFSPLWSSNSGGQYGAQYSIYNTTSATLNGTVTLSIFGGGAPVSGAVPLPPGLTFTGTNYVGGVPVNKVGTTLFAYDGPPGSLTVSAAVVNFSVTPAFNQPVPFEAVRVRR